MNYSVLMTVYKNDNPLYFEQSIDSILNQTVRTNDFVIVKDGPVSFELQNIINHKKSVFPKLINEIQLRKNVGLGLALNEGLKVCKNDLVARMDADDISLVDRCETQIQEFIKDSKLDIIGSSVLEFIGSQENIICRRDVPVNHEAIVKFSKRRDPFNHPTVMYKKSKVLASGGYRDLRKNQDTDLWIRMLMDGAVTQNIEDPLLLFRFQEETYKKRKNWLNTKLLIKIRYEAAKNGYTSAWDFMNVLIVQLAVYIMPIGFVKWIYRKFLRTPYELIDSQKLEQ